ncbi:MAG: HEAT repeat domain-containing protein [Deltaproteobacteria bacterium]|nr:HEAT repeat domain-containing protein [Deltaproteobacteria bacterium]
MHNFYPQGHPNLDSSLAKCYILLKKCVDERGEITWKIDQKGFYDGKTIIASGSLELAILAKKFLYRKVRELTFTSRLTQQDLKLILQLIKLEPEELASKGGAEAFMAGREDGGILLNEMRYEELLKLKKELAEKKAQAEALAQQAEAEGESDEEEQPPPKEAPQEKQDTFEDLLERLKKERDFLKYNDLLARAKEKAGILLGEKKCDDIFPALLVLSEHSSKESTLPAGIKQAAYEGLEAFLGDETIIRYLAGKVSQKEEPQMEIVQQMLLRGKDRAAAILLDALIDASDASARRNIYNTVILFGKTLTPHVETRLKNGQWFAVRQMAAILGELALPETLGQLEAAFKNPHIKVKREVLKSISRIQTPRSTAFLVKTLESEDRSLMTYAVIALGMRRDPAAIEPLSKIALRWEPFSDKQEPKKEAVRSLGLIGDQKAVEALTRILFRTTWFGKKINEEFKCLAAGSLAMIGGSEAMKAIETAYRQSEGELNTACKKILERKEKAL